uniref:Secreted protein n=1 Tax=Arundo donax TaxID=35708 RepID=A0A0A9BF59_ARUDO
MLERLDPRRRDSTVSFLLFSFLAARMTVTPCTASWQHTSRPIPLFPPVTTASLSGIVSWSGLTATSL